MWHSARKVGKHSTIPSRRLTTSRAEKAPETKYSHVEVLHQGPKIRRLAEIRRLHRGEGMPIKVIARAMGCSKNTVRAALRSEGPPTYVREPRGSLVDEVEPRIRELLKAWPTMPATAIAERIGWEHSIRILRDRVADLRPVYLPPDPASRTTCLAGELAQCDFWFSRGGDPGRVRAGPNIQAVAGVGDGVWLLPGPGGTVAALAGGCGPVRGLVVADAASSAGCPRRWSGSAKVRSGVVVVARSS
jgi:hypothetical protein